MADWSFDQPLWLLLLVPLLTARLWQGLGSHSLSAIFATRVRARHPMLAGRQPARDRHRLDPRLLAATALFTVALAQPVQLGTPRQALKPAVDLHVLLDTSVSMVLTDYRQGDTPVQRLTFAKGLVDRLAVGFGGERLSLYLVGSPSRSLLPPTRDVALFRAVTARVEPVLAGRRAELGDALARLAGDLPEPPRNRAAIAVLVTDGSQPSGMLSPEAGAARLQAAGVPLYVLVVGAGRDSSPRPGGLLFDAARPGQLAGIARLTGGESFVAADIQGLQDALATLTARHLAKAAPPPVRTWPLHPPLIAAGLIVLLLPGRRRSPSP